MSASARPRDTLRELIVLRQLVTSDVPSSVETISLIASGGGAAMQVYMLSMVIVSLLISLSGTLGASLGRSGVPCRC